jgi:hypothetical protein
MPARGPPDPLDGCAEVQAVAERRGQGSCDQLVAAGDGVGGEVAEGLAGAGEGRDRLVGGGVAGGDLEPGDDGLARAGGEAEPGEGVRDRRRAVDLAARDGRRGPARRRPAARPADADAAAWLAVAVGRALLEDDEPEAGARPPNCVVAGEDELAAALDDGPVRHRLGPDAARRRGPAPRRG